jgi:hypothetical protein
MAGHARRPKRAAIELLSDGLRRASFGVDNRRLKAARTDGG